MSGPEPRVGGPVADDRARVIAGVKAEALREAAEAAVPKFNVLSQNRTNGVADWLRERAAAVAAALPTPAPEAETLREKVDWLVREGEERGLTDEFWSPRLSAFLHSTAPAPADEDAALTDSALVELLAGWVNDATATEQAEAVRAFLTQRWAADQATLAAAWDEGMRTGTSRAMRRMSDEPDLPLASDADNPYRAAPDGPDAGGGRRR